MLRPGDTVLSAGRVLYVVDQIWRSHHHIVIHTTSGFPVDYFEHDELTIRRH
jgi:hypothetical protein